MADVVADVRAFMQACGQATPGPLGIPHPDIVALRRTLIDEEVNKELLPALDAGDLVGIADGCADAIVVIIGTALAYGIPLHVIWAIVDRSNMAKVDPVTGKVSRRGDGKIMKPHGWLPPTPQIAAALELPD
jgi:predicted HAD superfamily Cof-like phosphohydrolase